MESELRTYMEQLTSTGRDRFVGSRGHRSAFNMITRLLRSWGLHLNVQPFTVTMTVPVRWNLEIDFGAGFEKVQCLPGVGSPTVTDLVTDIVPVGHAREEDYNALTELEGRAHLAQLWKNHETVKVTEAARRGAGVLIWYNDYIDELYSGACDYSLSPIPGVSVKKSIAERLLEAGGGRIRFSVRSRNKTIKCRNIEAGRNPSDPHYAILASHYDSRPHTPGASDDASGVAAMLAYIGNRYDADAQIPVRFFFADCEEEGCVGAQVHAGELYRSKRLGEVRAVVNLDAVGWPNLCLIARDREAVMDRDLTGLAALTLEENGQAVEKVRSKSGRSNHTPFAVRGVPTVWYSDYPNYIRHSAIDNAHNIDYPTMELVADSLRSFFGRIKQV